MNCRPSPLETGQWCGGFERAPPSIKRFPGGASNRTVGSCRCGSSACAHQACASSYPRSCGRRSRITHLARHERRSARGLSCCRLFGARHLAVGAGAVAVRLGLLQSIIAWKLVREINTAGFMQNLRVVNSFAVERQRESAASSWILFLFFLTIANMAPAPLPWGRIGGRDAEIEAQPVFDTASFPENGTRVPRRIWQMEPYIPWAKPLGTAPSEAAVPVSGRSAWPTLDNLLRVRSTTWCSPAWSSFPGKNRRGRRTTLTPRR
jgi:hypothetical protein